MIAFNLWAPDFDCFRSDLSRHLDLEFSKFHDIFMVLHNLLRCMIWYNLTVTFLDSWSRDELIDVKLTSK